MEAVQKNTELRKVEVQTLWKGKFQTENRVRNFSFLIDEPEKLGGDNQAPTPLEYVVGAFNGCILVVIEMVAKEIQFHYEDLRISSVAHIDRRGLAGTADVSPYYQDLRNTIVFQSAESQERLDELKKRVQKRCPMYNLLKDTGIPVILDWNLLS